MGEDDVRSETIGGETVTRPATSGPQQEAALSIELALRDYSAEHGGWVSDGPRQVALDYNDVVIPDVIYLAQEQTPATLEDRLIHVIPSLVVEAPEPSVSPQDRNARAKLYAQYSVPEYWRVDCESQSIERWTQPSNDGYSKVEVFSDDDLWSESLPDFVLSLDDVFSPD